MKKTKVLSGLICTTYVETINVQAASEGTDLTFTAVYAGKCDLHDPL